jgi:hypothetical protein
VSGDDQDRGAEPGESPKAKHDRELIELLNELRVALPGAQVLFAFLFILPFTNGWTDTTPFQRALFLAAFLATGASLALLMAPSAYHRLCWRVEDKGRIVTISSWLAIAGIFVLAVALVAGVLLVTDFILSRAAAVAATASIAVVLLVLWYGLALTSRERQAR